MSTESIAIFVPATIGNVGPGFDVLGLCLDGIGDRISGKLVAGKSRIGKVEGVDAKEIPIEPSANVATIAADSLLAAKGHKGGIEINFSRELPLAGGLGSSAAASVGGAMLAAHLLGCGVAEEEILQAALVGESAVAGEHLDNIAPCLMGGLCIVQSTYPPRIKKISANDGWRVVLIRQSVRVPTKEARALLPESLGTKAWTQQMGQTAALVAGFATGDAELVRFALLDFYAEPARKHLIPNFDQIQTAARQGGALGCTISGAGPTMFALVTDDVIAARVKGDIQSLSSELVVHVAKIGNQGARRL